MKITTKIYLVFTLLTFINPAYSQLRTGEWRDYFSYSSCRFVNTSDNKIIAANNLGLFYYLKDDNSYLRLNKTNGLNDIDICALLPLSSGKIIIGYINGNIDIIDENEIVSIPDLKNKNMVGSKQFNQFYEYNNRIYCSMPFGIMVINPDKNEISDTYYIGPDGSEVNINQITVYNDDIYAATEKGIFKAPANSPALGAFDTWEEVTDTNTNYSNIINYNEYLITAKGEIGSTNEIYYLQNDSWIFLKSIPNFRGLTTNNSLLGTYSSKKIEILNNDLQVVKTITKYSFAEETKDIYPSISSVKIDQNDILIADNNYGIVKIQDNAPDQYFYPDGPMSNSVFNIAASAGVIYVTAGGIAADWNNLSKPGEYSYFDGISWTKFRRDPEETENNEKIWRDFLRIVIDPSDAEHAYMCSWGTGVFELSSGDIINNFNQYNSGLQNIDQTGKPYYVRVGGIAIDKDHNLWMNNGEVDYGLVLKTYDDKWIQYTYKALSGLHSMGQILTTKNSYFWMIVPRTGMSGLFVFDINNTPEEQNDDRYRCALTPGNDNDPRNAGQLKLWDENEEEITNHVYSLAEDKDGYIWVGTDKGVLVYYRPYAIFDKEKPVASRIKVPRNDGSNLADYLLEKETVTAIAVDGGNRKWLGTANSGIFLVSEDGTKTIYSFNVDNSPLISNNINSIAIQPKTGEVLIGTDMGIVSYKGIATEGESSYNKIYAYPNPVRESYTGDVIITGLMENSVLKIVDISGNLVYETTSLGGQAVWNRKNLHGEKVKTGVYVVFVSSEDGSEKATTKILIVN